LGKKSVLEIGTGRGYLQDIVENIRASIFPRASRAFTIKNSLSAPPRLCRFRTNFFDGVWSIWVFEHVPNPEQAFREMRRMTRDQGVIFLLPAWNAESWAAQGYAVRPYSDFGPLIDQGQYSI